MTVYADNAATTRCGKAALNAMLPFFHKEFGNPSSLHSYGQKASAALQTARESVARSLGASPQEIYFTGSGSESDNQAIRSAALTGAKKNKRHLITSAIEHHAVLHTLNQLKREGFEVTILPVDKDGLVTPEQVADAIRMDSALVTIMTANNEVGTIEPVAEIAKVCKEKGVIFHTDAVQAAGHIPLDIKTLGADMLSLSGHKLHGPKGVGVLWCRKGVPLLSLINGGGQERMRRAGTENIPGIVGLAVALEEAVAELNEVGARLTVLRDKLIAGLSQIERSRLNGHPTKRLPGNVNFCFEGIEGESLLLLLDQKGVCASSGSACTSGSLDPSHVLLALGLPHEIAHGSLRLSFSRETTEAEIDHILSVAPPVVNYLRSISPVWESIQATRRS
ncbi:MAG: cysteine desulfurase NifS [Oscillospiraceae bacterium]|jgi:cysteine desulfurase|nr:cysteine desulfurase NifS [Oscillospiraceae bacterium]